MDSGFYYIQKATMKKTETNISIVYLLDELRQDDST